jgi:hypothetical protein
MQIFVCQNKETAEIEGIWQDGTKESIWMKECKQEKDGENYMKRIMICTCQQKSQDCEVYVASRP